MAKKASKQSYGFCYDKQGNLREVSAPVTAKGKAVKAHTETKTGSIPASVGFPSPRNR